MNGPTQEELKVLQDRRFLIIKQHLSEKVIRHLANIERLLHKEINNLSFEFPEGTFLRAGKISKGENYRSLPYFLLDYPRMFTRTDAFAFRTMLWWGNEFSCTLHLSGLPMRSYIQKIIHNLKSETGMYFCIYEHPWEYHFEPSNYLPVEELSAENMEKHVNTYDFIKISTKIPLDKWDQFADFSLTSFKRFLKLLD